MYAHSTRTVAALERAGDSGRGLSPGQKINYVVVDDSKRSRARVQLVSEATRYDAEFYSEQLLRAGESVLSPLGWRQEDIEQILTQARRELRERADDQWQFNHGEMEATVRILQDVVIINLLSETYGILLSLDAEIASRLYTFVHDCQSWLSSQKE